MRSLTLDGTVGSDPEDRKLAGIETFSEDAVRLTERLDTFWSMPTNRTGPLLAALVLSACAPEVERLTPVGDVQELMIAVIEPAAEVYWDAVGEILDSAGVHEIRPASDEEWEAVSHAAFLVAESGNLLMMSGRARDRGDWTTMSQALIEVGREALKAADARNSEAVFDAGAEIYYVCSECHAKYAAETLRPNDARGN